jgi:hypothetical protein
LLQFELDEERPQDGFTKITVAGRLFPAARLLALVRSSSAASINMPRTEGYVRGPDVIAVFEEAGPAPIRVDCLWRASEAGDPVLTAIDLVVSVHTRAPDSRPEIAVASAIPATDILRLRRFGPDNWSELCPTPAAKMVIDPEGGAGCQLFRLPGDDVSYAEMVHPADFQYDELERDASQSAVARLAHRLFQTHLEKGVLLRARVRGLFLRRADDMAIAARCYAAFADADPPLGA